MKERRENREKEVYTNGDEKKHEGTITKHNNNNNSSYECCTHKIQMVNKTEFPLEILSKNKKRSNNNQKKQKAKKWSKAREKR